MAELQVMIHIDQTHKVLMLNPAAYDFIYCEHTERLLLSTYWHFSGPQKELLSQQIHGNSTKARQLLSAVSTQCRVLWFCSGIPAV